MVRTILKSESVLNLHELLRTRYGRTLKIGWIQSQSNFDLVQGSHQIKDNQLHIPICVQEQNFAMATIDNIGSVGKEDQLLIVDLVKLVLESEFQAWYLTRLSETTPITGELSNVVSIHGFQDFINGQNPISPISETIASEINASQTTNVIFFHAANPHLLPRLVNEVHEISQRWACLQFKDIQSEIHSVQDIKSLGSLTLIINDILQLSPQQQDLIYQYLLLAQPDEEPLLVISSSSEMEDLETQKLVHPMLAELLKSHLLEVDRLPRDSKLLHEALEIMLES